MVYYSQWIQLDDYSAGGEMTNYPGESRDWGVEVRVHDPSYELNAPELGAVDLNHFLDLAMGAPYEAKPGIVNSTASVGASVYRSFEPANVGSQQLMTIHVQALPTTRAGSNGPIFGIQPPSEIVPTYPAGATGYEWADPIGTVISGVAHFAEVQATGSADNADPTKPPQGDWSVVLGLRESTEFTPTSYAASTLLTVTQTAPTALVGNVDITGYIDAVGAFQVNGEAKASVGQYTRNTLSTPSGRWSADLTVSVRDDAAQWGGVPNSIIVTYTVRPPLFRWVYEGSRALPPLRQFPRDDEFSSARRIWPPPSSEQGGARRLGYY